MATPPPPSDQSADNGPGAVLELIVSGRAQTRSAIVAATGLARSTVLQRLDALLESRLVIETDERLASGGRPARVLQLNTRAGVIAAVDVGEERTRIVITDLGFRVIADHVEQIALSDGPAAILDHLSDTIHNMLLRAGPGLPPVVGLGLGLPAPVDYGAGKVVGWSIMSGWDGYDIRPHLQQEFAAPILIDNDVNLLTLAEHRRHWPTERHLFYVKAGTGIGSGMIIDGALTEARRVPRATSGTHTSPGSAIPCVVAAIWAVWSHSPAVGRWPATCAASRAASPQRMPGMSCS